MKYINFKRYKFSTVIKNIKTIGYNFLRIFNSLEFKRYDPRRLYKSLRIYDATKKLPFKNNSFDLVISLGTLHNFSLSSLSKCIFEINRVGKKSYIMVESYRNDTELFNLQCWALTCESFFSETEWKWLYKEFNYSGDHEFIYFR
mgnify:CR=1 FL=1